MYIAIVVAKVVKVGILKVGEDLQFRVRGHFRADLRKQLRGERVPEVEGRAFWLRSPK